ncbi:MAG: WYL domain-containing protein [Deferribacteraceae bacterium]|jgi:predicted DNA-binding transcriptional regulator YafY|nr:WYL domain-containing protein [Deferribacteraceae bacterium]
MELDKAFRLIEHLLSAPNVSSKSIREAFGSEIDIRTAQRYKNALEAQVEHVILNPDGTLSLKNSSIFRKLALERVAASMQFNYDEASVKRDFAERGKIIVKSGSFLSYERVRPALEAVSSYLQVQQVQIRYKKRDYVVKPYLIILEGGFWSLAAFCEDKPKSFRLDRIRDITPFSPPRFFEPERRQISALITAQPQEAEKVEILVASDVADYFKQYILSAFQKQSWFKMEDKKNGLKFTFLVVDKFDFILQAAPWACFIKVLSPKRYRNVLTSYLKAALEGNEAL